MVILDRAVTMSALPLTLIDKDHSLLDGLQEAQMLVELLDLGIYQKLIQEEM